MNSPDSRSLLSVSLRRWATTAILLLAPLASARASVVLYTDRAAFTAALGGAATITETFDTKVKFAAGDNSYNGINFRLTATDTSGFNGTDFGGLVGDEYSFTIPRIAASMEYIFSAPIFALGADFLEVANTSPLNWVINGVSTQLFATPRKGFFGVISTDAFTSVDVTSAPEGINFLLDDLTYARVVTAPPAGVPDAGATLWLLVPALLGLHWRRRP